MDGGARGARKNEARIAKGEKARFSAAERSYASRAANAAFQRAQQRARDVRAERKSPQTRGPAPRITHHPSQCAASAADIVLGNSFEEHGVCCLVELDVETVVVYQLLLVVQLELVVREILKFVRALASFGSNV